MRKVWIVLSTFILFQISESSIGDQSDDFKNCLTSCQSTGYINGEVIDGCVPGTASYGQVVEPLALKITKWDCESECKYQCVLNVEKRRSERGLSPVKYYGKWPFTRVVGAQEIASVVFSALNFLATLFGLVSFVILVYRKLPRKTQGDKGPLYEYSALWIVYGLLALNSWFWSAIFHTRDTPFTQSWDYSSAIALIGGLLLLSIIRTAGLRLEAARVMVSAPVIGFVSTHILYLNFYEFDYGWNIQVCAAMGITQVVLWVVWGWSISHPSKLKLSVAAIGALLAMLLELYDFPPYFGLLDAHSLWHLATVPLTLLWWSFVCDDAKFITTGLLRKATEEKAEEKKTE